jgi:hypothetical protein
MTEFNIEGVETGGFGISPEEIKYLTLLDTYSLGLTINYLYEAGQNKYPVGQKNGDHVFAALDFLVSLLQARDIESAVAGRASQFKSDIENEYENPEDPLREEHGSQLERKAITWSSLLQQDLKEEQRIPAAETGVMEVEELLESPDSLFSQPVWNWLDERPESDIREACKSIVVGSPTASVMLSLRAAEHYLREWHEDKTGNSLEAAWGRVLGQLMDEYLEDSSENKSLQHQLSELPPVLSNLYYLKEKRNEVNHPQKSPTDAEARRTLMLSVGTISEIYDELVEEIQVKHNNKEITIPKEGISQEELLLRIIRKLENSDRGAYKSNVKEYARKFGLDEYEIKETHDSVLMEGRAYEPTGETIRSI